MSLGERITKLRKQYNMSQADLARALNASRTSIGNYERDTSPPPIDAIRTMAVIFDVSIDYLVGGSRIAKYDKDIIKRIEAIQELDEDTKGKLFFLIDSVVQNYKTKEAHQ